LEHIIEQLSVERFTLQNNLGKETILSFHLKEKGNFTLNTVVLFAVSYVAWRGRQQVLKGGSMLLSFQPRELRNNTKRSVGKFAFIIQRVYRI